MNEITVQEFKKKVDAQEEFQLIDVREPYEHEMANISGELIPLGEIFNNADKISRIKQVIIYCRSGNRSAMAIIELQRRFGFTNLYNLKGGIITYAKEIDNSLTVY